MGESKTKSGLLGKILRHPLLYWILGWTALGFVLTPIFEKIGIETAQASAWQVANFLILLTVLIYFAKDPLREYLAKRSKEISGSIDEAKKMRENAESSYQDLEYKLEWIEDEISGIESKIREEAERERSRIIEEAKKQIERIKNETEFTARQELKVAEARLREEAVKKALQLAEDILKSKLSEEDEARLIEEYLQEVERGN
jgi:F-type H+-transporting ATPase subunit b